MSDELDGVPVSGVPIGYSPETHMYFALQIDKEYHAAYATLIEQDRQAIRTIVREELQRQEGFIRAVMQEELEAYHDAYYVKSPKEAS